MSFLNKIKISHKLSAAFIVLALCTAAIMAWMSYTKAKNILLSESEHRLQSTLTSKTDSLTTWMEGIKTDLQTQSAHPTTVLAVQEFIQGWQDLPANKTQYLKTTYIDQNPNPTGSKELYDAAPDGSAYSNVHQRHHAHFRKLLQSNGYYDIFLFDPQGNLVYSVYKEQDYATNFITGEWAQSDLGTAFRDAAAKTGELHFYDFKGYGPSNDAPASFISQAIMNNGQLLGVMAYQMPVERLANIMQQSAGLGDTGEAFLVGADHLMRSDSRFSETSTILKQKVDTQSTVDALNGKTGVITALDYRGKNTIAAYGPLKVMDVKWGVVVQQEVGEMMTPILALKKQILFQLGIAFAILSLLGFVFSRLITKPIAALVGSIDTLANGDLVAEIPYQGRDDELGEISDSMTTLRDSLSKGDKANQTSLFKGTAFDGSSIAMMVVDRDLVVTFVNQSTMELFSGHAEAFKEVFPDFDPKDIVGTCIDVFHKHPEHQRKLLADPSKMPYRTDISVGDLKFSLSVSMVMDAQGNHVGNSLEWDHVTVARTNTGIMDALDREQALIEFNLDGSIITANENFLAATGYELSEIKGKHHRMFVAKDFASTGSYSRFWEKLNSGQSVSGKFERFGKSGNSIWLDASYTSVLDGNDKPFKVIKIATDITKIEKSRTEAKIKLESHAKDTASVVSTLAASLSALSEGDLTKSIDQAFNGEYEQLRLDFNRAVTKLSETMRTILTNSMGIQTGATELSQASEDLSTRTENQAAALEETAAALDEVTATVQQTAKSANQANTVVATTRGDAEKSGEVVREAVKAMSEIKNSSGEIEKIIGVIDEIAFQTNLLALNAGVEAARAGEAGRGFAVVASEVRALAQRSSDAAKDIKDLISTSGKHVDQGVELVNETGTSLEGIVKNVIEVNGLVSDIATSAQEQATGLAEVNSAVNDMDRVTQQNAAMTEQSTAACHSLTSESEEMTRLVNQFSINGAGGATTNVQPITTAAPSPVAAQQEKAAAFFAASSQGSAALELEMDSEEDNDWQDF